MTCAQGLLRLLWGGGPKLECYGTATTSAARRPMSKRKSADANDLGVDDPKQVRLRAYPVSMFGAKKRCFNAAWYQR